MTKKLNTQVKKYLEAVITSINSHFDGYSGVNVNARVYNRNKAVKDSNAVLIDLKELLVRNDDGTGRLPLEMKMRIYCLLKTTEAYDDKYKEINNLVSELILLLRFNNFKCGSNLTLPINLKAKNILLEKNPGMQCIQLEWEQTIFIGPDEWSGGVAPKHVMVSKAPKIGKKYKGEYRDVTRDL